MPVVLFAEDDIQLQVLICKLLEKDGFTVITAGNGDFALERSRTHNGPVDLLLADIEMPRMSGLELSRKIREERPGIKVLFMSGAVPSDQCACLNGLPLLLKPFTPARLRHSVAETLRRNQA